MHAYIEILKQFENYFAKHNFPPQPVKLYEPCSYLLNIGGKRIRPVLCMMSHELFDTINEDVLNTSLAIELFHNFTLMHDDIMDNAPLRRGVATVHEKYSISNAILSGDVLNIFSYVHLNKIKTHYLHQVLSLFNKTAIEICEGQQMDMDFEKMDMVSVPEYINMISLKTAVLIGASLKLGALLGGATDGCADLLYQFGKSLGIAYQIKDDYLDVYGNSAKTGKQIGGDILSNKKTFLLAKSYELANENEKENLLKLLNRNDESKLKDTITFFDSLQLKKIIKDEIEIYSNIAFSFLEKVPVISKRKSALMDLTTMLLNRES